MIRALWSFFGLRRRLSATLAVTVVVAALAENLAIAAIYPLLSIALGQEPVSGGAVLDGILATVRGFPPERQMMVALALFLAVIPVDVSLRIAREWIQASTAARIAFEAKQRLLTRLRSAPYAYVLSAAPGDLTYQLTTAPVYLGLALLLVGGILGAAVTVALTLVLLVTIEPRLTLALALVGAGYIALGRVVARRFASVAGLEKQRAQTAEIGIAQEFLAGFREILVTRAGGWWAARFAREGDAYARQYVRDVVGAAGPALAMEIIVFGAAGIAAAAIAILAPESIVALVPVIAVYAYGVRRALAAVGLVSRQLLRLVALAADVQLLHRSLTEPYVSRVRVPADGPRPDVPPWRRLRMTSVTFKYPARAESALSEVTFEAARGELVAIVGPSGSGKSTLTALVMRLFDPESGAIFVDGTDVREISRSAWWGRIGYVSQELFVHSGTIEENIAFGRTVSRERIEAAARAAHAHDFVAELPYGYETPVGERGVSLSVGQRQRLALARALVEDPDLLVLDEVTSALDARSEQLVHAALRGLHGRCTVLFVGHRLATLRDADRIVVLERSRIVEQGTHEDLAARGGTYAQLTRAAEPGVPVA